MSVVEVQVTMPTEDLVLGQILSNGEETLVKITQLVPTGGALIPYFWVETADPTAFEKAVEADAHVASITRINEGAGRYLYYVNWDTEPDSLFDALREHDLVVTDAVGLSDEWRFTLLGPNRRNLSSFRESLRQADISSTVLSVRSPPVTDDQQYGLTDKQKEALELAFREGYFQSPAQTDLSELAETLGITRQSFSRRLKRGTHTIIANTIVPDS